MPRYYQGAVVRRKNERAAVLTGLVAVDRATKAWCYKEHVDGVQTTLAKSEGWKPYMDNMEPIWQPLDPYWIGEIRKFFPNIQLQ
jgi:hypothetical protein